MAGPPAAGQPARPAGVVGALVENACAVGPQVALQIAALHESIVSGTESRSSAGASSGSGLSINRNASSTLACASARGAALAHRPGHLDYAGHDPALAAVLVDDGKAQRLVHGRNGSGRGRHQRIASRAQATRVVRIGQSPSSAAWAR